MPVALVTALRSYAQMQARPEITPAALFPLLIGTRARHVGGLSLR